MGFFRHAGAKQVKIKPSEIIRDKLLANGGYAVIKQARGGVCQVRDCGDGKTFQCDKLPVAQNYTYQVFDVVVDLLIRNGKSRKGNGRNFRFGEGECTEDTVVGTIAKNYFGKQIGESTYDPVFVLAAVLEWAGIARNGYGYMELTPDYLVKLAENSNQ